MRNKVGELSTLKILWNSWVLTFVRNSRVAAGFEPMKRAMSFEWRDNVLSKCLQCSDLIANKCDASRSEVQNANRCNPIGLACSIWDENGDISRIYTMYKHIVAVQTYGWAERGPPSGERFNWQTQNWLVSHWVCVFERRSVNILVARTGSVQGTSVNLLTSINLVRTSYTLQWIYQSN